MILQNLDHLAVLVVDSDRAFTSALLAGLRDTQPHWRLSAGVGLPSESVLLSHDALVVAAQAEPKAASRTWSNFAELAPTRTLVAMSDGDSIALRIAALDAGAQDFLTKACLSATDLALRIKTRHWFAQREPCQVRVGALVVDRKHERVFVHGVPLALTAQQLRILLRLTTNPGQVVSYHELCLAAGVQSSRNHANLHNQLSRLRKRLGAGADHLVSVPGVGLRIAAQPAKAHSTQRSVIGTSETASSAQPGVG